VLVRGIEPTVGLDIMQRFRAMPEKNLTNGPGKLCAAMNIDLALDGVDICDAASPLFIARNPEVENFREARKPFVTTTRIGITRAADWPLRWYLGGSQFVSKK
jgi:DNA-3-methyladenine glycosylase